MFRKPCLLCNHRSFYRALSPSSPSNPPSSSSYSSSSSSSTSSSSSRDVSVSCDGGKRCVARAAPMTTMGGGANRRHRPFYYAPFATLAENKSGNESSSSSSSPSCRGRCPYRIGVVKRGDDALFFPLSSDDVLRPAPSTSSSLSSSLHRTGTTMTMTTAAATAAAVAVAAAASTTTTAELERLERHKKDDNDQDHDDEIDYDGNNADHYGVCEMSKEEEEEEEEKEKEGRTRRQRPQPRPEPPAEQQGASDNGLPLESIPAATSPFLRTAHPPAFGKNVPMPKFQSSLSTTRALTTTTHGSNGNDDNENDDDCPICKKYSSGPCGQLFRAWLKCSDEHPGKDEKTGEELHLIACMDFAEPLARCLEKNEEYYHSYDVAAAAVGVGGSTALPPPKFESSESGGMSARNKQQQQQQQQQEQEELRLAWSNVVSEIESSFVPSAGKRSKPNVLLPFPPSIQPEMQVRPTTMEGMASFAPRDESGRDLIMAYVKDQDGTLLGAGSNADVTASKGFIRFEVQDNTKEVTACALYEGVEEEAKDDGKGGSRGPIYHRTEVLPPK